MPAAVPVVVVPCFIALWIAAAPAEPEMKLAQVDDENSLTFTTASSNVVWAVPTSTIDVTDTAFMPHRFVLSHRIDGGWWEISCVDGRSPEFEEGKARCP